jgi:hypothetical protein
MRVFTDFRRCESQWFLSGLEISRKASKVRSREKEMRWRKGIVIGFLGALSTLVVAPGAFAQGCALCYTTAAAAGAAAARAIDLGILVLLVPALVLFVAVLGVLVHRAA